MAQDRGGSTSGQGEVDWDAVFRTIDHQGGQASVAVQVAQSGNNSGTLQSGEGVDHPHPQWHQPATDSHRHAHGQETGEDQVSEAALQEYFSRQWEQHGGPSNRRGGAEPRTMDPSSGLGYGLDPGPSAHQPDPDGQHNLAFRAMLGQEALVPPPRGRRRSHSLSLRRLPDIQTGLGPSTGPLTSYPTFPHHDLPAHHISSRPTPFILPSNLLHHNNPDVYSFFPPQGQGEYQSSTAGPSTPAPTPSPSLYLPQPYPPPHSRPGTGRGRGRQSQRQSISTQTQSQSQSYRQTPLNSAHPSPQAYTSVLHSNSNSARSNDDPPSYADQGSNSNEPIPGDEGEDSEDKRARNTMASARFRAKRKAHINNVERQITHLESQSTTLVKQVEDLRKENGFLKDMVQLKYGLDVDKRT